jgi:hypothetical protein
MHDAGMGGGHGSVFDRPAWRNWGIEREDVEFIPYWRNDAVMRRIGDGLICSMWKRPGSVILGILNYGPDNKGFERKRAGELTLDLAALGVPRDTRPERVRLRVLNAGEMYGEKFYDQFEWYRDLPGTTNQYNKAKIEKFRPAVEPALDPATGALTGFDVNYHDVYYVALYWEDRDIADGDWRDDLADYRAAALNWGVNAAAEITDEGLAVCETEGVAVRAWQRDGSVMVLVANAGEADALARVRFDLDALGLRVTPDAVWREFTSACPLGGGNIRNVLWDETYEETRKHEYTRGDLVYDGHRGIAVGLLRPGERRLFCVDRY